MVVIEKRDSFSRNNVLHLWPYTIHDLRGLGAKKFYGKFCAGAIDHISEYLKLNWPLLFFDLLSQIINSNLKVLYAAKNLTLRCCTYIILPKVLKSLEKFLCTRVLDACEN